MFSSGTDGGVVSSKRFLPATKFRFRKLFVKDAELLSMKSDATDAVATRIALKARFAVHAILAVCALRRIKAIRAIRTIETMLAPHAESDIGAVGAFS